MWKWGSRAVGGGVLLIALMVLAGAPGSAFVWFLITIGIAAALTYRVGLKTEPRHEVPANQPVANLFGLALRLQDKFGDLMLTPIWNAIRRSTGTKWD